MTGKTTVIPGEGFFVCPWRFVAVAYAMYMLAIPLYPIWHGQILTFCTKFQLDRSSFFPYFKEPK